MRKSSRKNELASRNKHDFLKEIHGCFFWKSCFPAVQTHTYGVPYLVKLASVISTFCASNSGLGVIRFVFYSTKAPICSIDIGFYYGVIGLSWISNVNPYDAAHGIVTVCIRYF